MPVIILAKCLYIDDFTSESWGPWVPQIGAGGFIPSDLLKVKAGSKSTALKVWTSPKSPNKEVNTWRTGPIQNQNEKILQIPFYLGSKRFSFPTLVTYESWGIAIFRKIWVMASGMFTVWRALASLSISEVPCGQTKGATLAKAQPVVEWCVVTSCWVSERISWTSSRNRRFLFIFILNASRITMDANINNYIQLISITWHVFSIGASLQACYLLVFCPCPLYPQKCIATPIICWRDVNVDCPISNRDDLEKCSCKFFRLDVVSLLVTVKTCHVAT